MSLFQLKRQIQYWLHARHRHGHGIHSPYLFGLLTNVIENDGNYYAYDIIDKAWESLMRSNVAIPDAESEKVLEKLKLLVRKYDLLPKFGKMLFRLVNEFQPKNIICAGPVSGMSLLYLAKANGRIPVFQVDGKPELFSLTNYLLGKAKVENVTVQDEITGFPDEKWEQSFLYVSYPEEPERSSEVIQNIIRKDDGRPKLIALKGIHDNPEMEALWEELSRQSFVRISLDFFTLGLAICRADLQKEKFVIRF